MTSGYKILSLSVCNIIFAIFAFLYRLDVLLLEPEPHKLMPYSIAKSCLETTPFYGTKLENFIFKTQNPAMALSLIIKDSVKAVKNRLQEKFVQVELYSDKTN